MSGAKRKVTHFVLWRATPTEMVQGETAACGAWLGQKAKRSTHPDEVDCSACIAKMWAVVPA